MDTENQDNIESRQLKHRLAQALALKTIFFYEGSVSMKEMEEAMKVGNKVGEIINAMASGNFLTPPPKPEAPKQTPKPEPAIDNSDLNEQLKSQVEALTGMLEQKQKEITHVYGSYENLRTTIGSQVEAITSKCNEIGAMVSSFQDEIYNTFTSKK
jgi:hypothetical protein